MHRGHISDWHVTWCCQCVCTVCPFRTVLPLSPIIYPSPGPNLKHQWCCLLFDSSKRFTRGEKREDKEGKKRIDKEYGKTRDM